MHKDDPIIHLPGAAGNPASPQQVSAREMFQAMMTDINHVATSLRRMQLELLTLSFVVRDMVGDPADFTIKMFETGNIASRLMLLLDKVSRYGYTMEKTIEEMRKFSEENKNFRVPGAFFGLHRWVAENPAGLDEKTLQEYCIEFSIPWSVIEGIREISGRQQEPTEKE